MIPYVGRMWRSDRKGERKRGIALGFLLWRSDKKRERQRETEKDCMPLQVLLGRIQAVPPLLLPIPLVHPLPAMKLAHQFSSPVCP